VFRRILESLGLISSNAGRTDVPAHVSIALLLIVAGIAVLIPGPKDALMSLANSRLGLGLSLDAPWYIGLPLIAGGVFTYIYGEHGARGDRNRATVGIFIALRHQSFEPLASRLDITAMPAPPGQRTIRHVECDQSSFFRGGRIDPAGAVRHQERMAADLAANRTADPDAAIGYYGIVHVPLQFLAGCSVSTWPAVSLFELGRADQHWHELATGAGPALDLTVTTIDRPADPAAIVIRIAISYDVPVADVADVVAGPFEDIRIGITPPRLDAVTHYGQVDSIAAAFRRVLDDIHGRLDKAKAVHVFYAGPVSLGFSLGRRISRTIHHRVIVYNYNARATPRYVWGIEVNGDQGALPMIIQPTSLSTAAIPSRIS
jgi:CBASS immunity sensor of nucleotide second messenger signals